MREPDPIVFVIDDDALIRDGIHSLIRSIGLRAETFASARDFMQSKRPDAPACLILDVRMPGLSGLDLQRQLGDADIDIPIIFITGHGDIPMTVRAMKDGAMEFLTKPVRGQDLLDAVQKAIAHDRERRSERAKLAETRKRFDSLTPRETEVLNLVVAGLLNKQSACNGKDKGRVPGSPCPDDRTTPEFPPQVSIYLLLKQDRFRVPELLAS
jgi:FixJ family two-component response regulator